MPLQGLQGFGIGGFQPKLPTAPAPAATPQMSTPAPMQSQEQFMTPEQNLDVKGISVDKPATPSFGQQQNFGINVDRKIEDMKKGMQAPVIDTTKGFGGIGQSFANMSQPGIQPGSDTLLKDDKLKTNFQTEKAFGVTMDAIRDVSDLSKHEMAAGKKAKDAGYSQEEFMVEVARKRKETADRESGLGDRLDIFKEDALNEGIEIGSKEYSDALNKSYEESTKSPYLDPTFKGQSFMDVSDDQQKLINDEPYLEGPIRFINTIKGAGAFVGNIPAAAVNLGIFVSELITDPKKILSDMKGIPDAIHEFSNKFMLDNSDKPVAEQALRLVDDVQKFVQENPDIVLAPEEALMKGKLLKSMSKLAPDIDSIKTAGILTDAGKATDNIVVLDKKTTDLINKGIKPTVAGKQSAADLVKFQENVVKGVDTIIENKASLKLTNEFGEIIEGTPNSLQQYSESIGQTKKTIFNKYNNIAKEAGKTVDIPVDNIAKELTDIINNKTLDISSPGLREYAQTMQDNLAKIERMGVEEAQTLTQQLNKKLQAFYRNPNANDIGKNMIDNLINNNLKQSIDNSITSAMGDAQYSALKSKYSELVSVEKEVAKRALVEARKANKGLMDLTDIFSAGEIVGGLAAMNPAMIAKGIVQKGVKDWFKRLNSPDRNIKKLFERVEGGKVDIKSLRDKSTPFSAKATAPPKQGLDDFGKQKKPVKPSKDVESREVIKTTKKDLSNLGKKEMKESIPQLKATVKADDYVKNISKDRPKHIGMKTESDVYNYAVRNKDKLLARYKKDVLGGKVAEGISKYVNLDDMRYLINNHGGIPAGTTHKAAKFLEDQLKKKLMRGKSGKGLEGLVAAGGAGSGKGSMFKPSSKMGGKAAQNVGDFDIIFDKVKGNKEVALLLDKGRKPTVNYVHTNINKALDNALGRTISQNKSLSDARIAAGKVPKFGEGRTLKSSKLIEGHTAARSKLSKYFEMDDVKLDILDNSGKYGEHFKVAKADMKDAIKAIEADMKTVDIEGFTKKAEQAYKDGKITKKQYQTRITSLIPFVAIGGLAMSS